MTLTPEERETIPRFDNSGREYWIWTASPTVAARLRKAGLEVTQEPGGWRATCAKQAVRIKAGRRACYVGGTTKKTVQASL